MLADELPIVEEDWNFSGIPREELRFAEIYEYSREIKLVRDAFTEWLDSEAWMVEYFESQDHSIGIEPFEETFGFGCSNRELIATLNIQGKYSVPGFGNVGWESIGDEQPDKLAGHRLSAIVEMLGMARAI